MSLFSDFKKKKKPLKEEKKERKEEEKKAEKKEEKAPSFRQQKKTDRPAKVLQSPHLSEKAIFLEAEGQYVFRVARKTNKIEIKKAFEEIYGVEVQRVRIINLPRKKRNWRGQTGYQSAWKKAIIQVAPGEKINIH